MNNVYISPAACGPLKDFLREKGFNIVYTKNDDSPVSREISLHPDIYMCQMGLWEESRLFFGKKERLSSSYPKDAVYNALCTGKYFIHNLKHTDPRLLEAARFMGLETVNVKQGYSRCSCLPVDDSSFITSDRGMAKSLLSHGAKVLLISPGHVLLPGFPWGFIGGCGGNLIIDGKRCLVFNGDLSAHPDFASVRDFAKVRSIDILFFDGFPLTDIGSLLTGSPLYGSTADLNFSRL